MSRPQMKEETNKKKREVIKKKQLKVRTIIITPKAKLKKEIEVKKGQGLRSTRWKGLNFFILTFSFWKIQ